MDPHLWGISVVLTLALPAIADEAAKRAPMVSIAAGSYTRCLGCRKSDQHVITLKAFRIDPDEVTIEQYQRCVKASKCAKPKLSPKQLALGRTPVRGVTWKDAADYCEFVGHRLPTVAEWERAAHGPHSSDKGEPHYGSDPCHDLVIGGYDGEKCPTKFTEPNEIALASGKPPGEVYWDVAAVSGDPDALVYDLYGNVAEWTADWDAPLGSPADYFKPQVTTDPKGPATGTQRVVLGGSFAARTGSKAAELRLEDPAKSFRDVGFRCAADP